MIGEILDPDDWLVKGEGVCVCVCITVARGKVMKYQEAIERGEKPIN